MKTSNYINPKLEMKILSMATRLVEQAPPPAAPLPQAPQQNVANSNPMQPLPGQGGNQQQQQQVVGSSGGQPISNNGEPITIDTIIDRFNVIRGGKSFNEPEVYGQLTNIWNALPEQEKISFEDFLTKLGEAVTGPAQPEQNAVNARTYQNSPPPQNNATGNAPAPSAPAAPAAAPAPGGAV